ncbi:MAG: hypothetical protein V1909_03700 [Candidatus Micrarchaeota archaeon]
MVAVEKQILVEAWDKHIEGTIRQQRLLRFSSVADAEFCETFRNGIMAHKSLSTKEKREICAYTKLAPERATAGFSTRFFCSVGNAAPLSKR